MTVLNGAPMHVYHIKLNHSRPREVYDFYFVVESIDGDRLIGIEVDEMGAAVEREVNGVMVYPTRHRIHGDAIDKIIPQAGGLVAVPGPDGMPWLIQGPLVREIAPKASILKLRWN